MFQNEKFCESILKELIKDPLNGIVLIRTVKKLSLHPFYLNDVQAGLKEVLRSNLMKYDRQLSGILIAFKNFKLLSSSGNIDITRSHVNLNVEADYYVFRPEVGKKLRVFVNKKSKDHVGALAHTTFNVSIPKRNMDEQRNESSHSEVRGKWLGNDVQMGQEVLVRITFTDLCNVIPYIRGKIDHRNDIQNTINSELYLVSEEPKLVIERRDITSAEEFKGEIAVEDVNRSSHTNGVQSKVTSFSKKMRSSDTDSSTLPANFRDVISNILDLSSFSPTSPKKVSKTKRKSIASNDSTVSCKKIKSESKESRNDAKKVKTKSSLSLDKKSTVNNVVNLSPRSQPSSPIFDDDNLWKMQNLLRERTMKTSKKKNQMSPIDNNSSDQCQISDTSRSDEQNANISKKNKVKRLKARSATDTPKSGKAKSATGTPKSSRVKSMAYVNEIDRLINISKYLHNASTETNGSDNI